jgi:hypothetical protein
VSVLYHLGATTNSAVLPPLSLLLPPTGYEGEGALHLLPLSDEERDGPRSDDDDVYLQVWNVFISLEREVCKRYM